MSATSADGVDRLLVLSNPNDPADLLVIQWLGEEDEPRAAPPAAGDEGTNLVPGVIFPPGTVIVASEGWHDPFALLEELEGMRRRARDDGERSMVAARLARALATRLAPHVPETFVPEALAVWVADRVEWVFGEADYRFEPAVVHAAERAVDALQDEIAEGTGVAWPRRRSFEGPLPPPGAEIRGDHLHVWYGDRGRPDLELPPIALSELAPPGGRVPA